MQNLTKLVSQLKNQNNINDQHILNLIREYLQVLVLKAIYRSKYGRQLSFVGGTCLRICYDLKRYSEDLDFNLDKKNPGYSFDKLNEAIASFLKSTGFEIDLNIVEDKTVQKSFIKVNKILYIFGLTHVETQKLHIKIEIDTNPVKINNNNLESFFVTKFNENFPILKHKIETLFAGKIVAILNRPYSKGRDFYDLLWYLNRGTGIDFKYLNRSLKAFRNYKTVLDQLEETISKTNSGEILKDIGKFLEDPEEETVIKEYDKAFKQAKENYLKRIKAA